MGNGKEIRTGKVARMFKVDHKTITRWVDEFPEHFTTDAKGVDRTQRAYHPQDLIVLNTIYNERTKGTDTEEIKGILAAGELDTQLPPEAVTIEGETAISVYVELSTLRNNLEVAEAEISRLRSELDTERKDKEEKIGELSREIGKWQARYELLKEQLDEKGE